MREKRILMTRTLMIVASLTLALSPLMAADFQCTAANVAAGETWTETGEYNSSLTITIFDSARELEPIVTPGTSVTRTKTVKITGVGSGSGKIESVEVTYSSASVAAVVGKTYAVTVNGNHVDVDYAPPTTGTPSTAELAYVAGDNSHFGQFRAINKIFGGQTFSPNEGTRHINKNDAEELVNSSDDVSVESIDINFNEVLANGNGSFDVTVKLKSNMKSNSKSTDEQPNATPFTGQLTMDLGGRFELNPSTCRPTHVVLNGSNTMEATKSAKGNAGKGRDKMTVSGSGLTHISHTYTFPSAP